MELVRNRLSLYDEGMEFNYADGLLLVMVFLVVWMQWERGLILTLADIVAWVIGLMVGVVMLEWIGWRLSWGDGVNESLMKVGVFFLIVVMTVFLIVKLLSGVAERAPRQYLSGNWQKLLGGGLAVFYGALLVFFLVYMLDQLLFLNGVREMVVSSWFYENIYNQGMRLLVG